MSDQVPQNEPDGWAVGDSVKWTKSVTVYDVLRDPADSWTLTYRLRNGDAKVNITGSDNGDGQHLISLSAATTAAYAAGFYSYQAHVDNATDRYTVSAGNFCLLPDFEQRETHDGRSWARVTLESLEAVIQGKATRDQQAYSIAGRSLSRMSAAELMQWRNQLAATVAAEDAGARIAQGKSARRTVHQRFRA